MKEISAQGTPAAGTGMTFTLDAELGGVKKLVMSRPVEKSMDGERAALDTAQEILESS